MGLAGTVAPYHSKALPAGALLREWTLERVLGVGGFGIVYQGKGVYFGETVAIKEYFPSAIVERRDDATVAPADSSSAEVYALGLEKFLEEAKALWALSKPQRHPNIVSVRSLFEVHGTAYMVMDFEAGAPLSEAIRAGRRFSERELLAIVGPIADGLDRAHAAGVLHRDIKPANILLADDGRPVLIDFGSARFVSSDATSTSVSFYTAPYAALEQYVKTYPQGPWTDIYALGVVLYQCITGEKPPEVLERLHGEPGTPLAVRRPTGFSTAFLTAVDAAMAIRPDARPRSLSEWLAMFLADDDDATRIGGLTNDDVTRIRTSLTATDWKVLAAPSSMPARLAGPTKGVGALLLALLAAAAGFAIVVDLQHGASAPVQARRAAPALATAPHPPTIVPDLDAPMAVLVRDARAAGRPTDEVAALEAARTSPAAAALRARNLTGSGAAQAIAALNQEGATAARDEAVALRGAATAPAVDREDARWPQVAAAMHAWSRARAALDADLAAATNASSATVALAAADRALVDQAAAGRARAALAAAAARARRQGVQTAIARGEAAADDVLRLAAAPRPWLFAPAAKKVAYRQLQAAGTAARAARAELAALSPGTPNAAARAAAFAGRLAGLHRQAAAAAQALH